MAFSEKDKHTQLSELRVRVNVTARGTVRVGVRVRYADILRLRVAVSADAGVG